MNHSFNIEIAKIYGVDEAIMIENIFFWTEKNRANKKHFNDGRYWTYNSVRAFSELFPYWSEKQISRILKNIEDKGAVITGNFNKKAYDRTKWYSITEEVESLYRKGQIHFTKQGNGFPEKVEPIPDINTDINIKNNNDFSESSKKETSTEVTEIKEQLKETSTEATEVIETNTEVLKMYSEIDVRKVFSWLNSIQSVNTKEVKMFLSVCNKEQVHYNQLLKNLKGFIIDGLYDGSFSDKSGNFIPYSFGIFSTNPVLFERLKNYVPENTY